MPILRTSRSLLCAFVASAAGAYGAIACGSDATSGLFDQTFDAGQDGEADAAPLGVTVSPSHVDFGDVACGMAAAARTVSLTNASGTAIHVSATLVAGEGSSYTVAAPTDPVSPGGSVDIVITPKAIPTFTATSVLFEDTLVITTDGPGDSAHAITLSEHAAGVIVAFDPGGKIDFGTVSVGKTAMQKATVVNTGNAPAHVSLGSSNGSFTALPTSALVNAGAKVTFDVAYSPLADAVAESGTLDLQVAEIDARCGQLPPPVALAGIGTKGDVAFSPGALDFGGVDCGTQGAAQSVTFSNAGNEAYTVTPMLGAGDVSPYALEMNPATGIVAANGGSLTLTVTPKAIPATSAVPGSYGDTLTVTTTAQNDIPHSIALAEGARGAILVLSTSSIDFGQLNVPAPAYATFTIQNSGNATPKIDFTGQGSPTIFVMPKAVSATAGATTQTTAQFAPPVALHQSYSDTATVSVSNAALCQPLAFSSVGLKGSVR